MISKKVKKRLVTASEWATMLLGIGGAFFHSTALRDDLAHAAWKWSRRKRRTR